MNIYDMLIAKQINGGGGITPTGTIEITENGTGIDVAQYAYADVNVSGGGGVEDKEVRLLDYDGTVLHSYTPAEFAALSALPENPSHTGLTAQGWNWTLSDAKTYVSNHGYLDIGQSYITDDGSTRLYISLPTGCSKNVILYLNCSLGSTIKWGDGEETETTSSGMVQYTHSYAQTGNYCISISGTSLAFSSSYNVFYGNKYMATCLYKIEFGSNVTQIANYAFSAMSFLRHITLHKDMTSWSDASITGCKRLECVVIPYGMTTLSPLGNNGLTKISVPNSITTVPTGVLANNSLIRLLLPDSVTSIGAYAYGNANLEIVSIPTSASSSMGVWNPPYQSCESLLEAIFPGNMSETPSSCCTDCYKLKAATLPSGLTKINQYTFKNCYSLPSITVPTSVTAINSQAFANCYGLVEIHMLPTTPPTLSGSDVFSNLPSTCVIYVPSASLSTYQNATTWSSFASQMVGE